MAILAYENNMADTRASSDDNGRLGVAGESRLVFMALWLTP